MYKRIITGALLFGMAALGPPAYAMTCGPRDGVVNHLTSRFSETLSARGLQNAQSIIEIWTSQENGTYTILITRTDGVSCVVSSGTHWLTETPVKVPDGVAG